MNELAVFEIERFAIHDGPGIRTTVFLQGCPLRCAWCANPESQTTGKHILRFLNKCTGCGQCVEACSQKALEIINGMVVVDRTKCISCGTCMEECPNAAIKISGRTITCDELFRIVMRDADYYITSGGGVTLSGGEALLQINRLIPFLVKCKESGISVAVETCGHVSVETVQTAEEYVDLFMFDIKTLDSRKLKKYTNGNLDIVLSAFEYLGRTAPEKLMVRVPVIPDFNDNEIAGIMEYAAGRNIRNLHLLPYHTLGVAKYRQLGLDYPYHITESLAPDKLLCYVEMGEKLGINVKIGG